MGDEARCVVSINFFVAGEPLGEPRTRARGMMIGGKARARVYRDTGADVWKQAVARAASDFVPKEPIDVPVGVTLGFVMPRPKSRKKDVWHTAKPDADNLAKAVLDVLTKCGVWVDDSRVAFLHATKSYECASNPRVGCWVSIRELGS